MEIARAEQVNEALTRRSQTATLDELARGGRKQVKVIRAADVASMITETVQRVLSDTEMLSEEDLNILVEKGTDEFKQVFAERQREARQAGEQLQEVRQELERAQARVKELEAATPGAAAPAHDGGPTAELMMRMMQEMAEMKASMAQQGGGSQGDTSGIAGALDKISSSLNDRLEKFGRKMGISSAVEGQEVKYDSLFNDDHEAELESNMGDVQAKKKTGGGIAGNLERLKKLKGGD